MAKKIKPGTGGYVYSTNPDFTIHEGELLSETPAPGQQKLTVRLDTKHRAGKAVTLVEGFRGKQDDLEDLGKKLKSFCGTGGSAREGEIIVQGDQRDKVMQWLQKNGYSQSKRR